jgi:hypothetical protein
VKPLCGNVHSLLRVLLCEEWCLGVTMSVSTVILMIKNALVKSALRDEAHNTLSCHIKPDTEL